MSNTDETGQNGAIVVRDPHGRFGPGNPGGPGRRGLPAELKAALEGASARAAEVFAESLEATKGIVLGRGAEASVEFVPDNDLRLRAAEAILNRLYGRPAQAVFAEDEQGNRTPVGIVFIPLGGGGEPR